MGRWRTFFEFEEHGGLQLDVSAASGVTSDNQRNTIVGLGAKYKWMGSGSGFPVFTLAGEALAGFRNVSAADEGPGGDRHLDRWGAYLYGQSRTAGGPALRGDWTQVPTAPGTSGRFRPTCVAVGVFRFRAVQAHRGHGLPGQQASVGSHSGAHPTERF
jgi:hypothetical protein